MQRLRNWFNRNKQLNSASDTSSILFKFGDEFFATNYNDRSLALEGYIKCVMAYRCISLTGKHASLMRYKLAKVDETGKILDIVTKHDILKLLNKPYPRMTKSRFINRTISQGKIYGDFFIEKRYKQRDGFYKNVPPVSLYPLRPDCVNTLEGSNSLPSEYIYNSDRDGTISYKVTPLGKSNIIHGMDYNPQSDFIGLSPLVPAGYSVDMHNQISKSALNFVANGSNPSGILTVPSGVHADPKQLEVLKRDIDKKYSGTVNKGKAMILNNGMTWQQISVNNSDSGMIEIKEQVAKEVGAAFNVPIELLNIVPAKFDNYDAAYEQFYFDAVLPSAQAYIDELNEGLLPLYKDSEDLLLMPDFSHTKVMRDSNMRVMEKVNDIRFLSKNEKREMVQREPLEGHDEPDESKKPMTKEENEYIAEQMKDGLTFSEAKAMQKVVYG